MVPSAYQRLRTVVQGVRCGPTPFLCLPDHSITKHLILKRVPLLPLLFRDHSHSRPGNYPPQPQPQASSCIPFYSHSLSFPNSLPPTTTATGDLGTYLFGAKDSTAQSDCDFTNEMEVVLFVNIATSGQTRTGTATASTIGGAKVTGGYQPTVHGKKMAPSPDCDPFTIQKANILPRFTNVPPLIKLVAWIHRKRWLTFFHLVPSSVTPSIAFLSG